MGGCIMGGGTAACITGTGIGIEIGTCDMPAGICITAGACGTMGAVGTGTGCGAGAACIVDSCSPDMP